MNDEYKLLTGNQTGAILIEYLLTQRKEKGKMPANGRVFKTIVTSDLGRVIARISWCKYRRCINRF